MRFGAELARRSLGVAAGLAVWTLTEYVAHRWFLHSNKRDRAFRTDVAAPHTIHHRRPLETSTIARVGGVSGIAAGAYGAAAFGVPGALAAGWATGYVTYDITHWFAHHRPARTKWGEQLRTRHLRHHHGAPHANFGVTVDWWDQVFGTVAKPAGPGA